jgi:hypothetical protein
MEYGGWPCVFRILAVTNAIALASYCTYAILDLRHPTVAFYFKQPLHDTTAFAQEDPPPGPQESMMDGGSSSSRGVMTSSSATDSQRRRCSTGEAQVVVA